MMKVRFMSKEQRAQKKIAKEEERVAKEEERVVKGEERVVKEEERVVEGEAPPRIANGKCDGRQVSQQFEGRERSRDLKQRSSLTAVEQEERKTSKAASLGLLKSVKPRRHDVNYRQTLMFEWDKADDTSGGYLLQASSRLRAKLAKPMQEDTPQDILNKPYEDMAERDWRIFREDNQIFIKGGRVPHPFREWTEMDQLNNTLVSNLLKMGFTGPKPIQMQAIPIGLTLRDLLAIAPTGEGKTLAYLIPILQFIMPLERIRGLNSEKGPYALILVPSRQLAQQIESEYLKISSNLALTVTTVVGGHQIELQSLALSGGCELIIGTPGRVKQLIQVKYLSLERLSWVVIDEADKMISENLMEEVQFILDSSASQSVLGGGRKVMHMFSATMVPEIEKMAKTYLDRNTAFLTVGEPEKGKKEIEQQVQFCSEATKGDILSRLLRSLPAPIIVFVNTRQKCEKLAYRVQERFSRTTCEYHGGKNQEQREKAIAHFRSGKVEILIATDLAGRGLDVQGISAVINYDAPKNISEFIHRTGRTGRAGMTGKAFTLLTPEDQALFYDLRVFLERNHFNVPETLKDHPAAMARPGVAIVPRKKQIVYTN